MRFLVDAQLPRILAEELVKNGHHAIHTRDLPRENHTSDNEIRRIADLEDMVVVSKDNDFVISHLLHNRPRKILIVSTGNIPNLELLKLFINHLSVIINAFQDACYVELSRSYLVVHS
jgi:predicted nuclease of predicted toxin-antitoxin system